MDDYQLTQEKMAERVGKKRATVANYLRLLKLPAEIQIGIKEKMIDMGHARAILGSPSPESQLDIYKKIIHNGLSVRKVEELVNNTKPEIKPSTNVNKYEQQQLLLEQKLGRKVKITAKKLTISFKNEEELNRLIELLS
jgi:ParB family chromosome partitioning protein